MGRLIAGSNYTVCEGDMLYRIAIQAYGVASKWTKIAAANNISNPHLIFPGQVLFIPPEEEIVESENHVKENRFQDRDKNIVTVIFNGHELPVKQGRFAHGIDILASSYNTEIAWIPGKDKWIDEGTARGSFAKSELYIGPKLVCTGRLYGRESIITTSGITRNLDFFSVTADLVDSTIPPAFSEIKNCDLKQITEKLLSSHGFPVLFKDPPGPIFHLVERNGIETVAKFIQRLASQRGLFVSCDEYGRVIFQKAKNAGKPVAGIEYPGTIATEHKAKFDDRLRFSKYFVSSMAGDGKALNATASDPDVPAARQLLFEANDSDASTIQAAAEWRMQRIELEALSVEFPVAGWFDGNGELWQPNTIVTAKSPVLDIPEYREFIIRQVEFVWSSNEQSATLKLVPHLSVDGNGKLKVG